MSKPNWKTKGATRRDFVKHVTVGLAGLPVIATASASRPSSTGESQNLDAVEIAPGIIGPKSGKYAKYVRPFVFQKYLPGPLRTATRADGQFLGHDVCIEYGVVTYPGRIEQTHVHDFDQVMFLFGGDCEDMGELNGECELFLGPEKEKIRIANTTAIFLPRGFAHGPLDTKKMDKRFFYMQVSLQGENKAKPGPPGPESTAPAPMFGGKYRDRVLQPAFIRKAPGSYGPLNPDDSGGALATITSPKNEFPTLMMVESIKKAPYRFGPQPDKPHTHTQPEFLSFIGADPYEPDKLGAEVECYMGPEGNQERYIFTVPVMWIVPATVPHLPLIITKVDKPFIISDCRPFGSGSIGTAPKL